jgi:hypothetical protein
MFNSRKEREKKREREREREREGGIKREREREKEREREREREKKEWGRKIRRKDKNITSAAQKPMKGHKFGEFLPSSR